MPDELISVARRPFVAFTGREKQDKPIVAVDLGYSARSKSCGLCWSSAGPILWEVV